MTGIAVKEPGMRLSRPFVELDRAARENENKEAATEAAQVEEGSNVTPL